jgi:DNA primase
MDLVQVKSADIEIIADRLGLDVTRHKTRCISQTHRDSNPSLSFNMRSNRFKCFGCDLEGSVIDLVMIVMGFDFKDALDWLASDTSPRLPDFPAYSLTPTLGRTTPSDTTRLGKFYDLCDDSGDYLSHKGLDSQVYGVRRVTPEASKLLPEFRPGGLVIPYYQHGVLTWARWRNTGRLGQRFINPRGMDAIIYNQDVLSQLDGATPLMLCEGETDTMSATQMGYIAIGFPGATQFKLLDTLSHWVVALEGKIPQIICAFDDDIPGNSLAFRVAALGLPVPVESFDLAGHKDLNDYYQAKFLLK